MLHSPVSVNKLILTLIVTAVNGVISKILLVTVYCDTFSEIQHSYREIIYQDEKSGITVYFFFLLSY